MSTQIRNGSKTSQSKFLQEDFAKRMKEVHKEAEAVLRKSQEEMRKYTDRKRDEPEEY